MGKSDFREDRDFNFDAPGDDAPLSEKLEHQRKLRQACGRIRSRLPIIRGSIHLMKDGGASRKRFRRSRKNTCGLNTWNGSASAMSDESNNNRPKGFYLAYLER